MMKKKVEYSLIALFFLFSFAMQLYGKDNIEKDIISVIQFGIKNDGSVIGTELNDLVRDSYGKHCFSQQEHIICRNRSYYRLIIRKMSILYLTKTH